MVKTVKFTCDAGDLWTPAQIIEKLGLEDLCQTPVEGNGWMFAFDGEKFGKGVFDVSVGTIYPDDGGPTRDYYEEELGCYSLMEALDVSTLLFVEDEDGNQYAYVED